MKGGTQGTTTQKFWRQFRARKNCPGMPGFTEAVLCWLPAKTAIEAVSKVEEGYVLSESELVLLRERVGRREHTPSHLAAVAASASGLAIIEERLAGGFLLSADELTELRQHVAAMEAAEAPASATRVPSAKVSAEALFRAATAATMVRIHTHRSRERERAKQAGQAVASQREARHELYLEQVRC